MLPSTAEIVQGDLWNIASMRAGLDGADAIYIDLGTGTADLRRPFYEEGEGMENCRNGPEPYRDRSCLK